MELGGCLKFIAYKLICIYYYSKNKFDYLLQLEFTSITVINININFVNIYLTEKKIYNMNVYNKLAFNWINPMIKRKGKQIAVSLYCWIKSTVKGNWEVSKASMLNNRNLILMIA